MVALVSACAADCELELPAFDFDAGLPDLVDAGEPPDSGRVPEDASEPNAPLPSCGPITRMCGERCVDTRYDPAHCGACDQACGEGQACEDSACVRVACAAPLLACDAQCVDPSSDREHCGAREGCDPAEGAAGEACLAGNACADGACAACPMLIAPLRDQPEAIGNRPRCEQVIAIELDGDRARREMLVLGSATYALSLSAERELVVLTPESILQTSSPGSAEARDLDGDGLDDLLWRAGAGLPLAVGRNLGGLRFEPFRSFLDPPAGARDDAVRLGEDAFIDAIYFGPEASLVLSAQGEAGVELSRTTYALEEHAPTHALGDLDGDGLTDVIAAQPERSALAVLYGEADGSLREAVYVELEPAVRATLRAGADLDGDGNFDLVVGDDAAYVLLGRGDGTFQPARRTPKLDGDALLRARTLGDDARADLYAVSTVTFRNTLTLFGEVIAQRAAPRRYTAGLQRATRAVDVGDVDGDGFTDLVACADEMPNAAPLNLYFGTGPHAIDAPRVYDDGFVPLHSGDLDGRGADEIVGLAGSRLIVRRVSADLFEAEAVEPTAAAVLGVLRASALEDVSGDGRLDLVFADGEPEDASTQRLNVLLGRGDGSFTLSKSEALDAAARALAVGDFDGDGYADIALALEGDRLGIELMLGSGSGGLQRLEPSARDVAAQSLVAVRAGDRDVLVAGDVTLDVIVLGFEEGRFATRAVHAGLGDSLSTADLDGDGARDLVAQNANHGATHVLRGIGDGSFYRARFDSGVGHGGYPGLLADLDRDGFVDLVQRVAGERLALWPGDRRGGFYDAPHFLPDVGQPALAADLDGDGLRDLFFRRLELSVVVSGRDGPGCPR
jgi:hypothetical protein